MTGADVPSRDRAAPWPGACCNSGLYSRCLGFTQHWSTTTRAPTKKIARGPAVWHVRPTRRRWTGPKRPRRGSFRQGTSWTGAGWPTFARSGFGQFGYRGTVQRHPCLPLGGWWLLDVIARCLLHLLYCTPALAHSSSLDTGLTRNTRVSHFTPQHWLLCHMGLY